MTKEELLQQVRNYSSGDKVFFTQSGHKISLKEHKFINSFLINGECLVAAQDAGYKATEKRSLESIGRSLLRRDYIYEELLYRLDEMNNKAVADANEIMQYFTGVMRGEIKDQFDLDAPLSERTNAAKELAKRVIDVPAKSDAANQINITLDWKRDKIDAES